jgi:hypothetical protein
VTAPTRPGRGPAGPCHPPVGGRPAPRAGAIRGVHGDDYRPAHTPPLVIAGWIAAPHSGLGLPGVVRTAPPVAAAHHVEFTLSGVAGSASPARLVLLPGACWRAGRWVVRTVS